MPGSIVLTLPPERAEAVRAVLQRGGFRFEERPHAFFLARRPGVTVTFYSSGKLLLTGPQADEYARILRHGSHGLAAEAPAPPAPEPPARFVVTVGSDETGKGDYFGPLVVSAVLVPDAATARDLSARGVRDSKQVPDDEARLLGSLVAARCPHETVSLRPAKYNELHAARKNLNILLAWAHARALDAVVTRADVPVERVVVDRFARGPRLAAALPDPVKRLEVIEEPRAEARYLPVAAASLLARAEFLRALAAMEEEWGQRFPKSGGGRSVETAARRFVQAHGAEKLGDVAKLHFATTQRVTR